MFLFYGLFFPMLIVDCLILYSLPATLSLKRGRRLGLAHLNIRDAADQLRSFRVAGLELVEASRTLVAHRMAYCRRNSFDFYQKAFDRGYGYCQQQAFALKKNLDAARL